jgi:hypothetical protein
MKNKPITAGAHGLTDYAFGLALLTVPKMLGSDKRTVQIYQAMAGQIFLYSALTKQPYALKQVLSLPTHKKIDILNLATLALFSAYKGVRANKNTLAFNIGMTVLGMVTVCLTDWKKQTYK